MYGKTVSVIVSSLLVISALASAFNIQPVKASGIIFIRADGSVDPSSAPISTVDNITYTFTGNIDGSIGIERDSIVVDGAGYTVQGIGAALENGLILDGRNHVTIKNAEMTNFSEFGIWLADCSSLSIYGNNIANSGGGIWLYFSSNNTLSGNNIANSVEGIWLDSSSNNTLSGNNIANNYDGIVLASSSNNTLSGNNVTANNRDGIVLASSSNNTLSGNNVTANNIDGIALVYFSSNNTLSGNNVANNSCGIWLMWPLSSNNTLSGNNVANNLYGIYLINCSDNFIFHNSFVNNTNQVYTENSTNIWDDGYPSGGNFWSNYTGVDEKMGSSQDLPGSDGIGDIPYFIDANNTDRYPLVNPYGGARLPSTRYSWSMFHGDLGHNGHSRSPAAETNRTMWICTTEGEVRSSPVVAGGIVFVGSNDSKVYALDQYSGEQIWTFATGGEVQSSPAVADGKVYAGSFDGKVYCLNATTGSSLWNCSTEGAVLSSPAVAGGRVYVGSWDNKVYCLPQNDPDGSGIIDPGEVLWTYATGGWITSSPAVVADKVYVGSVDGKIYCLDALTGVAIWNYTTGGLVLSSPAVADERVYVGSDDGKIYCLDASNGNLVWSCATGNRVRSSPAVAKGKVFVGSDDGNLSCLDAITGTPIWNHTTSNWIQSSPAVADDKVYVGSFDGTIDCLNASTGQALWSYITGSEEWSSPAVADGIVYMGSGNHAVYAFGNVIRVPEDYGTIQEAVDAAAPGSTIWIAPGIYNESVVVNKTLTIIGKKGSAPIFGGGGSGVAITLLSGASGSTIAGVVTTYWDIGILIRNASDCKIYDNIISLIKYNGIVLEGANAAHNLVYCNMFERNGVAINLTSSSNDSDVFQNILSSGGTGICLESDGNSVYANTISGNDVGINITNSNDNEFYHNNFEGNSVQLRISVSTGNVWDNGYPSGGNYWSDHTAIDVHSGPYQNETGSDGIVDTPYVVAGNNVDNYPLSKPFSLHNIGITSLVRSKTVVGQSYTLRISVKIQNLGMYDESFTLTVSANETVLDRVAVGVTMKKSVAFDLSLSTSKLTVGNYTLSVVTDNLPGETENSDNSFNCSVTVTIPGDLNGDFTVDIYDAIMLANAYNSTPGKPNWNPNADINSDNIVDIYDAIILANHYNQHYP